MTRRYRYLAAVVVVAALTLSYVAFLSGPDIEENVSALDTIELGSEKTVKSTRTRSAVFTDIETLSQGQVTESSGPNTLANAPETKKGSGVTLAERCQHLAEELLSAMRDKDGDRMMKSLQGLVSEGDAAVPELARLLRQGPERDVKETAARGLAQIGTREAVSTLLAEIKQTSHIEHKRNLVGVLSEIQGTRSAGVLLDTLLEEEKGVLRDGVRDTVGRIADSKVVKSLVNMYEEKAHSAWQERNVLATIPRINSRAAVPGLSDVLTANDSISLRSQAAIALGVIASKDAVYALASAISDGSSPEMAPTYAQAIASIKNKKVIPLLRDYLTKSPNENLRRGAALALGNNPLKSVVDTLESALESEQSEQVRQAIEYSIQEILKERDKSKSH